MVFAASCEGVRELCILNIYLVNELQVEKYLQFLQRCRSLLPNLKIDTVNGTVFKLNTNQRISTCLFYSPIIGLVQQHLHTD